MSEDKFSGIKERMHSLSLTAEDIQEFSEEFYASLTLEEREAFSAAMEYALADPKLCHTLGAKVQIQEMGQQVLGVATSLEVVKRALN